MKQILIVIAFIVSLPVFSQKEIKVKIADKETGRGLPFATITVSERPTVGWVADIKGAVTVRLLNSDKKIVVRTVGYEIVELSVDNIPNLILLKPIKKKIKEVVVYSKENPAHRIIKKAVRNRKLHNPDKYEKYSCELYNKTIADYTFMYEEVKDSIFARLKEEFDSSHYMVLESITDRYYQSPEKLKEEIKTVRVSGFEKPSFAPLSTDLQPFHFYDELVGVNGLNYLNPISPGSWRKYVFALQDTLYAGNDSIFVISFEPKRKRNFSGFKGFLHINTNGYAIQSVVASPVDLELAQIRVEQKYQFVNKKWFPKELNFEFEMKSVMNSEVGFLMKGESFVNSVSFQEHKKKFDEEVLVFRQDVYENVDERLQKARGKDLSVEEVNTYHLMDSISQQINLDKMLFYFEELADWKIPVGKFYIPANKIFVFNDFEGTVLGAGLYTSDRLIPWMEVGGWTDYGFKDKKQKYGGDLNIFLDKKHETKVYASYKFDALFPGKWSDGKGNRNLDPYLLQKADYANVTSFGVKSTASNFNYYLGFNNEKRDPQYDYAFLNEGKLLTEYTSSEAILGFRFAFRERFVRTLKRKVSIGTDWPVLQAEYRRGLKDVWGSEFSYDKLWVNLTYDYESASLGQLKLKAEAGKVWGDVPYSFLFDAKGTFVSKFPLVYELSFNGMRPNTFTSDRYVHLFMQHDFGTRLLKVNKWAPHISIHQAIGFGELSNMNNHQNIVLKDMKKGYWESGVILNNLVKFNILNILNLGFGAATYYNYGYYAPEKEIDKFTFKMAMKVTF